MTKSQTFGALHQFESFILSVFLLSTDLLNLSKFFCTNKLNISNRTVEVESQPLFIIIYLYFSFVKFVWITFDILSVVH